MGLGIVKEIIHCGEETLTTCRAPRYELGGQAVRLLINQILGCPDECKEIILPLELVIRDRAP